jgi:hypothetical protein
LSTVSNPDALPAVPAANFTTQDDGRSCNKIGAHMRKRIACATATTAIALAMLLWAKSAVINSHADAVRPAVGLAPQVMANPYLPIQVLEEAY